MFLSHGTEINIGQEGIADISVFKICGRMTPWLSPACSQARDGRMYGQQLLIYWLMS